MKLELFDKVLFRVPQFPINATIEKCWDELKFSIEQASPPFFEVIKELDYKDIRLQSEPVQLTIAKYFNRARFRATPYSTFASIGVCDISNDRISEVIIEDVRKLAKFADWKQSEIYTDLWKNVPREFLYLQSNSSNYRVGNVIRYVYRDKEHFELSEIPYYKEIEQILAYCNNSLAYDDLLLKMASSGIDNYALQEILEELIGSQLILTNFHPNIIGEDYFKSIKDFISIDHESTNYTICYAEMLKGGLDGRMKKSIEELIQFMSAFIEIPSMVAALYEFTTAFRKNYDNQAVQIMLALDPITGIGYGDMENLSYESELLKMVRQKSLSDNLENEGNNHLNAALFNKWIQGSEINIVDLSALDIKRQSGGDLQLPNTFSALIKIADKQIQIEHLGGASASSLLGRFNLADNSVMDLCRRIACTEQMANPDVLFFDIAYCGEPSVDNVNRRRQIYNWELSILNYDKGSSHLCLSDIYLQLSGKDLILFSRSLGKRLIPRLSSAYNYGRSDLPVFRLLCDLQTQGLRHSLLPDWDSMFSGLSRSPRIVFKNLLLHPAGCKIKYDILFKDSNYFRSHIASFQLGRYILIGHSDQTLLIDIDSIEDLNLMCSILKSKSTLWIKEAYIEKDSVVKSRTGNRYKSEFVLSFFHDKEIYKGHSKQSEQLNTKRDFSPGSEWLYYEVYSHPSEGNNLLMCVLQDLISSYQEQIACWFFIRYNEGGDHLRLRIKTRKIEYATIIMLGMSNVIKKFIESEVIRDVKLCTYKREIERFGEAGMDRVEQLFEQDSIYIMSKLKENLNDNECYADVINLMIQIGIMIFGLENLITIAKSQRVYFNRETKMDEKQFKELNLAYKDWFNSLDYKKWIVFDGDIQHCLVESYNKIILTVKPERRTSLFCDLLHMHINRLFSDNQRIHETIIYNYLVKVLQMEHSYLKHRAAIS